LRNIRHYKVEFITDSFLAYYSCAPLRPALGSSESGGWQSALIRAGEMRKASSHKKRTIIPTVILEGRPEGTLGKGGDGFCQRDMLSAYSLAAYGARFVVDGEVVAKRTSSHTLNTSYSLLK
jgi:hypothetical protein